MRRAYYIDENKRKILRDNTIKGARQYSHYLVDKDFLVLCEDGKEYVLHFLKNDFRHLTGIKSDLRDDVFFQNSKKGHLDLGNIAEYQKYNWETLKSKSKGIVQIHKVLYENIQNSLFLINLHTNTRDFPVAIKNTNINACIGFVDSYHKARTLRKYNSSNNADLQKKISLIAAKKSNMVLYNELVYTSAIKNVYDLNESILEKLSERVEDKFLEVLTKPEQSEGYITNEG